jgi:hypothetical protein
MFKRRTVQEEPQKKACLQRRDARLDGRIGPQIGVGVDTVGGLFRPERRQGRHYRRLADSPRGLVVRLFCGLLPLPAAALSVEDLGAEEGDQRIAGDEITVSVCCCLGEIGEG